MTGEMIRNSIESTIERKTPQCFVNGNFGCGFEEVIITYDHERKIVYMFENEPFPLFIANILHSKGYKDVIIRKGGDK